MLRRIRRRGCQQPVVDRLDWRSRRMPVDLPMTGLIILSSRLRRSASGDPPAHLRHCPWKGEA